MSNCVLPLGAMVPWAEANQGLLSILALAAALGIALLEHARANRAEDARRRDFGRLVLGLLSAAIAAINAAVTGIEDGHPGTEMVDQWNKERDRIEKSVHSIQPTVPPDPALALATAELAQLLARNPSFYGIDQVESRQHFINIKANLDAVRGRIASALDRTKGGFKSS